MSLQRKKLKPLHTFIVLYIKIVLINYLKVNDFRYVISKKIYFSYNNKQHLSIIQLSVSVTWCVFLWRIFDLCFSFYSISRRIKHSLWPFLQWRSPSGSFLRSRIISHSKWFRRLLWISERKFNRDLVLCSVFISPCKIFLFHFRNCKCFVVICKCKLYQSKSWYVTLLLYFTLTVVSICRIRANVFPSSKSINVSVLSTVNSFPFGFMLPSAQHKAAFGTFQNCFGNLRIWLMLIISREPSSMNETWKKLSFNQFHYKQNCLCLTYPKRFAHL